MHVKREIRILGIDDSPFSFGDKSSTLIGVVSRGGGQIDGVVSCRLTVDGNDATERIEKLVKESRHYDQIRVIMLAGITFAGFNIVDVKALYERTGIPVIVVVDRKPNLKKMKRALKKFEDFKKRLEMVERAGKIFKFGVKNKNMKRKKYIYYQAVGIGREDVEKILKLTCVHSSIPEPLRIAHMIGYGVVKCTI